MRRLTSAASARPGGLLASPAGAADHAPGELDMTRNAPRRLLFAALVLAGGLLAAAAGTARAATPAPVSLLDASYDRRASCTRS